MPSQTILGIDPGLKVTGLAVIRADDSQMELITSIYIKTDPKDDLSVRLLKIFSGVKDLIALYNPDIAAIENIYVNSNAASSLLLAQARAASIIACAQSQLNILEYQAKTVKKTLCGNGSAEKFQVEFMIKQILNLEEDQVFLHDQSDAIAIAITAGLLNKL